MGHYKEHGISDKQKIKTFMYGESLYWRRDLYPEGISEAEWSKLFDEEVWPKSLIKYSGKWRREVMSAWTRMRFR